MKHTLLTYNKPNNIVFSDRENKRVQCFAAGLTEGQHFHPRAFVPTGTFFTKAENVGRVYAIREKRTHIYVLILIFSFLEHYLVGVTDGDRESGQVQAQVFYELIYM